MNIGETGGGIILKGKVGGLREISPDEMYEEMMLFATGKIDLSLTQKPHNKHTHIPRRCLCVFAHSQ